MKTLAEIEDKANAISARMTSIYQELRTTGDDPSKASELAEELAHLLHEAKVLHCSLRYFQETARSLMSAQCSGPH